MLSASEDSEPEGSCDIPSQMHIVTFKCMGATYDLNSQENLKKVKDLLVQGIDVPVKLVPEPENKFDAKAIAFHARTGDEWQRIGYVVGEALDHVHKAMQERNIIYVKFAWAKYIVTYSHSGPGYFAGIRIAISGEWPSVVVRHASAF